MAPIDDAVRDDVLRALRHAGLVDAPGAPQGADVEVSPLDGGLGRRSYLAQAAGRFYVVRIASEERAGALELGAEAEITAEAAARGIAPRVIAAEPATRALITEHLGRARPLSAAALKEPSNIARVARLLRSLHVIRRPLRRYDPEAFAAEYTRGLADVLGAADRRRAAELHQLARAYRTRFPSLVLCHNDLVASNVLDDGGELRLVDFEYAVTAAPVLDLAGLAVMNDFDDDERWRLAEAYYEGAPVPFTAAELKKVARLVRLIAYFWALSSAVAAGDRGPYAAFAARTVAALDDNS